MNLSCLPVSYFGEIISGEMSMGQWAREAAELGLDAIDLSILFVKSREPTYLERVREEIEAAELSVAMVTTSPDFTHPNRDERHRQALQLDRDIAAAAALGAELVRVTAGQAHPETSREEGIAWATEGLTSALVVAERLGVQLVFENHWKATVWDHPDFSHPTDIFLAITSATAGTSLGINFDTANPLAYGYDPVSLLKQVIDRVVSVHAADTRSLGSLDPVLIGTGLVPFPDVFATLKGARFDGWICIEEASGRGRSGVQGAVNFIRQAWADAVSLKR